MSTSAMSIILVLVVLAGCASTHTGVEHRAAAGAIGPYSGAVLAGGFCFVAGKIAPAAKAGGSFSEEVAGAIDAVADELASVGLTLADVVSTTVYLTDMQQFSEFNHMYAQRFPQPYPARTTVGVAALPAGRRVEITVIAMRSR